MATAILAILLTFSDTLQEVNKKRASLVMSPSDELGVFISKAHETHMADFQVTLILEGVDV